MALATDLLARALHAARGEQRPEEWSALSASIIARIRATGPPSYPIVTMTGDQVAARDDEGSRTFVASRVASSVLRRVLQKSTTHAPAQIRLEVDDAQVTRVHLQLVAAYGTDLVALMDQVRSEVAAKLTDLLGAHPGLVPTAIRVEIIDVVEGDPNAI